VFDPSRPDRALLAGVPFGDAWLDLAAAPSDPREVTSRLAMYRLLIERGNAYGAFGPNDALSPWWGYASQLAWQHRSGRLGETAPASRDLFPASSTAEGRCGSIEERSWWGACNYALSVVPYVAAARLGLVPPFDAEIPADYDAALASWRVALEAARTPRAGDDLEPARIAIWRAHVASIAIAVGRHRAELRAMPPLEQRFARGWVRMVDLFGAAALRTDLERLVGGSGALPGRVLADDATLDALDRGERRTARRVLALADRPRWRWALEVRAWRRMMRTRPARDEAELLIGGLLGGDRRVQLRALRYLA
jgi:hypothetical protein